MVEMVSGVDAVLLTGPSSVGKSSTAAVLKASLGDDWLVMDSDLFRQVCPGAAPSTVMRSFYRSISTARAAGLRVIIDHFLQPGWLRQEALSILEEPVFVVGLQCPVLVTELRERERQDRRLGVARESAAGAFQGVCVDLMLDSSVASPQQLAARIVTALQDQPALQAWKQMLQARLS